MRLRRGTYCVVLLILMMAFCGFSAAAQDESGLVPIVEEFRETYGLNESNFSMSYYNTVTGEQFDYNENAWMVAASTYKLPLNMYYYDLEAKGELTSDSWVGGTSLERAHFESIVNSNNAISEAMIYAIGNYSEYKRKLLEAYDDIPEEEIDEIAYRKNCFCTRYMRNTLIYLYRHADQYAELIDYMKQAQEGAYFKKYITNYEIAHKYGMYGSACNDVAIVYTDQPYVLAVYTDGIPTGNPEDLLGKINKRVCEYNIEKAVTEQQLRIKRADTGSDVLIKGAQDSAQTEETELAVKAESGTQTGETEAEPESSPEVLPIEEPQSAEPQPVQKQTRNETVPLYLWIPGGVLVLLAAILILARTIRRGQREKQKQ